MRASRAWSSPPVQGRSSWVTARVSCIDTWSGHSKGFTLLASIPAFPYDNSSVQPLEVMMKSIALMAVMCGMVAQGPPAPKHFSGLLNDHTPSAAVVAKGPYEMRGKWSLDVDEARGTATFTAAMDMQTSDYGITQGTVNKDDPATRGAHTHHITITDGVVTDDWAARCPAFSPAATSGFVVTGAAVVTGNGSAAPFGNPTPATVCILG